MDNTTPTNIDPTIAKSNVQTGKGEIGSKAFLARFDDLDFFLEEAKIAVQYYFERQEEIKDYSEYLEFLKSMLRRYVYVYVYTLPIYEEKKLHADEGDALDEKYHKLINFGIFNPNEAQEERNETGMTIEEQEAKPKGLILRFREAVRKVF